MEMGEYDPVCLNKLSCHLFKPKFTSLFTLYSLRNSFQHAAKTRQ